MASACTGTNHTRTGGYPLRYCKNGFGPCAGIADGPQIFMSASRIISGSIYFTDIARMISLYPATAYENYKLC